MTLTPSRLKTEIRNLLDLLLQQGIAVFINPPLERRSDDGVTRITWTGAERASGDLFRISSPTVQEYREWVSCAGYSAMLYDGSLLQLSFDFNGVEVCGHRLVYLPCPFDLDLDLLRSEPALEVVDACGSSLNDVRLRSSIRFDFDPVTHRSGHPLTHVSLLWDHCRWAVSHPLSVGHFIRFVFRHFYPEVWHSHEFVRQWPQERVAKGDLRVDEASLLHVAWRESFPIRGATL